MVQQIIRKSNTESGANLYVVYDTERDEIIVKHVVNGKKHHDTLPAYVSRNNATNANTVVWYKDGVVHNDNAPASVTYDPLNDKKIERWFHNGLKHRVDGPALIVTSLSKGTLLSSAWYKDGVIC